MSTTVDSRVVEMRFDNKQFENNVQTSISTLEKLKKSLNLSKASENLKGIDEAAKKVDMSGLSKSVDTVRARFSALQVIGTTALVNITNTAVNAGKRMLKALTIDPIKTGFQEYELKMNSIQTIMSNTANKGTTMKDVINVLDELNTYADKTIYNFAEMTRNIGTFTAAGVGLEDAASAIQGIANLAAASGSSSQQASTAMYQLSQALAAGTVKLMDWNSVVNAGMGGQKFQEALKATAREQGIAIDAIIEKHGSFRESLQEGWITADVLNDTLKKFTVEGAKEYSKSMMESGKWTQKQADALIKEAQAMNDAATKVKTFTQLWDTLKEAAQSGWAQTWEIIVGNFDEAKAMLSDVSDTIGGIIGKQADMRNKILQGWKDLGGRTEIIEGIKNIFNGLVDVVKPIQEAFKNIFPSVTSKKLYNISVGFRKLTESFKMSEETADKLRKTFEGVFSILNVFGKIVMFVASRISSLFTSGLFSTLINVVLSATSAIGSFFTALNEGFQLGGLTSILNGITEVIGGAINGITGLGDGLSAVSQSVSAVVSGMWNTVKDAFTWIADNIDLKDVFAAVASGGIIITAKKLGEVLETIKDGVSFIFGKKGKGIGLISNLKQIMGEFKSVLNTAGESLQAFTGGVNVVALVAASAAIAVLANALEKISKLNGKQIAKSLASIGVMFGMLLLFMKGLKNILKIFEGKGLVKAGVTLLAIAKSIDILAVAMQKLSGLSLSEIAKGLIGIGGSMVIMSKGLKAITNVKISISAMAAVVVLANSLRTMSASLVKLGQLSWGEVARGLTAMGGALGELLLTIKVLDSISSIKSLGGAIQLLIAVQSLDEIADALSKIGQLSWAQVARGLTGMGGALAELGVTMVVVGKLGGLSGILGAAVIVEGAKSLESIAEALFKMGKLSWSEVGRGLTAMGGALTELSVVSGILGKLGGLKSLIGAVVIVEGAKALENIANAFKGFAGMSWKQIKIGLAGMGGALAELGIITGALGKLAGISGLIGSASLLIAVQGLGKLADAFTTFSVLSWGEIKRGLVAMGGALLELGVISGALGVLTGIAGLIGSGSILIACQGLGKIADALQELGSMSWGEIKHGLAAMGAALGEVALGSLLNTFSLIGAVSLNEIAEPIGVLAESVKKWGNVKVPADLGKQIGSLAWGITKFTFSGFGASALAEIAAPVGVLADSVKKWQGVKVPSDIGDSMKSLAKGVGKFTTKGIAASALAEAAGPVGTLADSVKKWTGIKIAANVGEDLSSLAKGVKSFTFAFIGGLSIDAVVGPLGRLAGDVRKWNGISITKDLGVQLKSLASGVNSFSLSFVGGFSISEVAGPLGQLADDIKKWTGVTVPEDLGDRLEKLASGVKEFNWSGSGASSISDAAEPLGILADSVTKWADVKVPTNLKEQLSLLSDGIKSFSSGGSDLEDAAPGLGSMATAIKKWTGVSVPNGLGVQLKSLASGVKGFMFGSSGASVMSDAAPGIGSMATAVKKWSGVSVPDSLGQQLKTLASGVKSFIFGGSGASAMTEAAPALGTMATSIKKWIGLTVPENLGSQLKDVAGAVKGFTFGGFGASTLTESATGLGLMATSVKKWVGLTVPENLGSELETLSDAVKKFSNSGDMTSGAEGIKSVANSIKKLSGVKFDTIITGIKDFMKAIGNLGSSSEKVTSIGQTLTNSLIKPINNLGPKLKTAGSKLADNLVSGLRSNSSLNSTASKLTSSMAKVLTSKGSTFKAAGSKLGTYFAVGLKAKRGDVISSVKSLADSASKAIGSKSGSFKSVGIKMADGFASGIKSNKKPITAASSMASSASTAIRNKYSSFYGAGQSLANGFANGISANSFLAAAQARAMANAAEQAAKDALDIHSPSRVFDKIGQRVPEGFANGVRRLGGLIRNSVGSMTSTAMDETKTALARLGRYINSDMDVNPTIRPVMDLSGVESGVGAISGMLGKTMSIGVNPNMNAVSSTMSSRIQNDAANDVVSAINGLRKELGNVSGNTYNLSGITYDDGSNVADAIQTLIRAAVVERRK